MSFLEDDIVDYLETRIAGTPGVNVFVDRLPDQPDQAMAVLGRGGAPPLMTLTGASQPESKMDQPMIQVRTRSGSYVNGRAFAYAAYAALHGITNRALITNGVFVQLIEAVQSPQHLGVDEKQRHEWSQNFHVVYENTNR